MSDWKYYSPSHTLPSAGDLLRAIPSNRNLRLERIVTDGTEESFEAVRAAETLFGLTVRLRLFNDPDGSMTLTVRDATRRDRDGYRALELAEPPAEAITVFGEIALHESAVEAGYLALADDVLCGLEEVFGGGVAVSAATGEVFVAADIATMMASEETPWTHVDVRLDFDDERLQYVTERLADGLPAAMSELVRVVDGRVELRGRFPAALEPDQYQRVWTAILDLAPYAHGGHLRFRERGTWSDVVEGIGRGTLADVPDEWAASRRGIRGVISRLLGRD